MKSLASELGLTCLHFPEHVHEKIEFLLESDTIKRELFVSLKKIAPKSKGTIKVFRASQTERVM